MFCLEKKSLPRSRVPQNGRLPCQREPLSRRHTLVIRGFHCVCGGSCLSVSIGTITPYSLLFGPAETCNAAGSSPSIVFCRPLLAMCLIGFSIFYCDRLCPRSQSHCGGWNIKAIFLRLVSLSSPQFHTLPVLDVPRSLLPSVFIELRSHTSFSSTQDCSRNSPWFNSPLSFSLS